jgi:hypothetical protein
MQKFQNPSTIALSHTVPLKWPARSSQDRQFPSLIRCCIPRCTKFNIKSAKNTVKKLYPYPATLLALLLNLSTSPLNTFISSFNRSFSSFLTHMTISNIYQRLSQSLPQVTLASLHFSSPKSLFPLRPHSCHKPPAPVSERLLGQHVLSF